ncbi:hypothetical protein RP20_CCG011620 [Aedes albopictus]|nr:hypothetical protein RP20_CCG011620 [Aedes albopictus]
MVSVHPTSSCLAVWCLVMLMLEEFNPATAASVSSSSATEPVALETGVTASISSFSFLDSETGAWCWLPCVWPYYCIAGQCRKKFGEKDANSIPM